MLLSQTRLDTKDCFINVKNILCWCQMVIGDSDVNTQSQLSDVGCDMSPQVLSFCENRDSWWRYDEVPQALILLWPSSTFLFFCTKFQGSCFDSLVPVVSIHLSQPALVQNSSETRRPHFTPTSPIKTSVNSVLKVKLLCNHSEKHPRSSDSRKKQTIKQSFMQSSLGSAWMRKLHGNTTTRTVFFTGFSVWNVFFSQTEARVQKVTEGFVADYFY